MIYVKLWRRCKIWDFRSKICIDQFKSKREFYRDSIFKSRIVSIDLSGEFRKELRERSSLVSRDSANLNHIATTINSMELFAKIILKVSIRLARRIDFLSEFREKVSDYIINEVIG